MRRPFQDLRTNPFANNNNYPGLDDAFKIDDKQNTPTETTSPDRSSSIISPPSDLNMSIGARAAINEHTRHIAKYGLDLSLDHDGHDHHHSYNNCNDKNGTPSRQRNRPSPTKTNITNYSTMLKDEEWDRLMDGSISLASFSSTFLVDNNKSFVSHALASHAAAAASMERGSNNTTLNITTDQSSDFFTSSRVALLTTPEKNKPKVDEASRLARIGGLARDRGSGGGDIGEDRKSQYYSESISGSTDASNDIEQSGMIGLFNAAMRFGERIEEGNDYDEQVVEEDQPSLVSFQEPNLSLICNNYGDLPDDEDEHCIPQPQSEHSFMETENYEKPIHHDYQESSFISYHEPDLSIISNHHEPDLSIIKNRDDDPDLSSLSIIKPNKDDLVNFTTSTQEQTKDKIIRGATSRYFKKSPNELGFNGSDESRFTQSHTLSGIDQNKEYCADRGHMNEFESQTISDFNPIFSQINDYEDVINDWIKKEKEAGLPTTIERPKVERGSLYYVRPPKHSEWEEGKLGIEGDDGVANFTSTLRGFPKYLEESTMRSLQGKYPSPQKSEFNVDVSAIMTTSECETRFVQSNVVVSRNESLKDKMTLLHQRSGSRKDLSPSSIEDGGNINVNSKVDDLSPISGDSPSEIDTATFKRSLPRIVRPHVVVSRDKSLRDKMRSLHQRSGKQNLSPSTIEDGSKVNADSGVHDLSPISGDSPSEIDIETFKRSLPSSASSSLSKNHLESMGNLSQSRMGQSNNRENPKTSNNSLKPQLSRLRERYSRPERFEDSYVMSTFDNSAPHLRSEYDINDNSVSRSLLRTFECASTPDSNRYYSQYKV